MPRFKAKLVFERDEEVPKQIEIDDFILIKRTAQGVVCQDECDEYPLGVFDLSVSGGPGHVKIFWEGDGLYLQDLGSRNGTFIIRGGVTKPLKGWIRDPGTGNGTTSQKVRVKKTTRIKVGRSLFSLEIEPIQTVIEHKGSGDIRVTEVAGDYQNIEIRDSIIQRSNIGTVSHGIDEKEFRKAVKWLDQRSEDRAALLSKAQEEMAGMTAELYNRVVSGLGALLKEFPLPASMEKKRAEMHLTYNCTECRTEIGKIIDRKWKKWLMLGVTGGLVGLGIATVSVTSITKAPGSDIGLKAMGRLFQDFTGKTLDQIPSEKFLLTDNERNNLVMELRNAGIIDKLNYCPVCARWVCSDCFEYQERMCILDSQKKGW